MAGRKPLAVRVLTPRMQQYLAALPGAGGRPGLACKVINLKPNSVTKWRGRNATFKKEEMRAREKIAMETGQMSALRTYAKLSARREANLEDGGRTDLPIELRVYLVIWKKERDRMKACRAAGIEWSDVQEAVKSNEVFAAAVALIQEEFDVELYDAQMRRAIETGDATAANNLRKRDADAASRRIAAPVDRKTRVERLRAEKAGVVN